MSAGAARARPAPDRLLTNIADYVCDYKVKSHLALDTARYCLMDSLGCAILALQYPACTKLLGPVTPGTRVPAGARVPGTKYILDPVQAAFNLGAMIRWLDFNDTWLAAEWGHPSDNLAGILAAAQSAEKRLTMKDVLDAAVKAHEIQGVLALSNSFNRVGLDHVLLVKVATAAVATRLLGGTRAQVVDALSNAWVDGQALRTYRHAPNTGPRKSWAAGDASARGVWLALMTLRGEMGYPTALSARQWGFQDALFRGREVTLERALGTYVMENVLFKISFPAEFHAQTAVEAAFRLHPTVKDRLNQIGKVAITTHESAIRIIDKKGPLHNPADRDHCLQYMTAVGLIFGTLTADHYEERAAGDPRIDLLREKMVVTEEPRYSREYLDPGKRSIANAVQVFFKDGTSTEKVEVEYPLGHRRRRDEGIPLLVEKFKRNLKKKFPAQKIKRLALQLENVEELKRTPVRRFVQGWA